MCGSSRRITSKSKKRIGSMHLSTTSNLIREQQAKLDMQEAIIRQMQDEMNIAKQIWLQQVVPTSGTRSVHDQNVPNSGDSQTLMNETAKIIADSSQIEKNAPICDKVDEDAWNSFALEYNVYLTKGGKKPLRDLLTLNVMNYYKRRLPGQNLLSMQSANLFDLISGLNQSILDPISILDNKLTMEPIMAFNKKKVQEYISSFITILESYPVIENSCQEEAIVNLFYSKLYPTSLRDAMQKMCLKTVSLAITKLHDKIQTKDIQFSENTQDKKLGGHVLNGSISSSTKICLNCKFNKDPSVQKAHKIWNCRNIDFCCRCNKKHLAMGPYCPHKDIQLFDYNKFLQQKKAQPDAQPYDAKQPQKSKQKSEQRPLANNATLDTLNSSLERLVDVMSKLDCNLQKVEEVKCITRNDIVIDTGCSETCINTPNHSDLPISRKDPSNNAILVADGREVPITGSGKILNHESSLVTDFQNSLLSVSKTNIKNNAVAIFTDSDCHIIKLDKNILTMLYDLLHSARTKGSVLVNGREVNGLYICDKNDIDPLAGSTCNIRYSNKDISTQPWSKIDFAGANYYSNVPSVSVDSLSDLVRFFHETWNHASVELMCAIVEHKLILNLPPKLTTKVIRKFFPNCQSCAAGNLQQRPFRNAPVDRDIAKGEEWEIDILGPFTDQQKKKCPSFSGQLYACTCKDIKTGKHKGFLLRNMGYLLRYLKYLVQLNHQRGYIVRYFRIDSQFITEEIKAYCASQKIITLPCIPYEHETLGNIERSNRTIREAILKCLASKPHLNEKYWAMCYQDVLFKMDLMPSPTDPTTNPYFNWYGHHYDMLKQPILDFGCVVMAHVPKVKQGMLTCKSIETYYVGVHEHGRHGGILLYDPKTKRTQVRRSFRVIGPVAQAPSRVLYEAAYEENGQYIYNEDSVKSNLPHPAVADSMPDVKDVSPPAVNWPRVQQPFTAPAPPNPAQADVDLPPPDDLIPQFGNDLGLENDPIPLNSQRTIKQHVPVALQPHELEPEHFVVEKILNHKGTAARPGSMQLFVKWLGYGDEDNSWISWKENQELAALDTYLANNPDVVVPVFKKRKFRPKKRLALQAQPKPGPPLETGEFEKDSSQKQTQAVYYYRPPKCGYTKKSMSSDLLIDYAYGAFRKVPEGVPRNFPDILNVPYQSYWIQATDDELMSMVEKVVWELPDLPESQIPKNLILPSQLIYDIQRNPDGTLKKFKCRLVIRGDKWYDIYDMQTYASTVKSETVKVCLAIAATEDMELESVDIKTAFLNSPLKNDEVIYMRRPLGLTDQHMPAIVKLKKCIYGMKQASAYFHSHSDAVLKSFGCVPTPEDDCCYTLEYMGKKAIINKHVDDFGIMSTSREILTYVKSKLAEVYEITVNEDMKYYLGYNIKRDRAHKKIFLDQSAYIDEIANKFSIPADGSFPSTPMDYFTPPEKIQGVPLLENKIKEYQSKVGSVLWLAIMTRPDILYAVSMASTKTKNPTTSDLAAVDKILSYLVGTKDLKLKLGSDQGVVLYATVDSSYASHKDSKSHSGMTLHIGLDSGSIMSVSKKQKITADSSTVAEFIAAHLAAKEVLWCRRLLASLGYPQIDPTVLFEDNMSTIAMIKNKSNGKRTKHLGVRFNMIRELVENLVIVVRHLTSKEMTSDILTKALAPAPFIHLRKKILGLNVKIVRTVKRHVAMLLGQ